MQLPPPLLPMPTPDEEEVANILCALPVLIRERDPRRIGSAAYLPADSNRCLFKRRRSLSHRPAKPTPQIASLTESKGVGGADARQSSLPPRWAPPKRQGDKSEIALVAPLAKEKTGAIKAITTETAECNQPQNLLIHRHQAMLLALTQPLIVLPQQSSEVVAAYRAARKRRADILREKRSKKIRN